MKILVLGGTRFFGKLLVDRLVEEGHTVTVGSRGKTPVQFVGSVERVYADRNDPTSMKSALSGRTWDLVYDQICFNEGQAQITTNLLNGKIGHLVFTSSQSVYSDGVNLRETWFDPTAYVPRPDNPDTYQEGKRLAEKTYLLQKGFPVTAVRFPLVLGAGDPTGRLRWHIARIKWNQPIFFPNVFGRVTVISAEDAAQFLKWLSDKPLHESINACSPEPLRLFDLVKEIEEVTGHALFEASEGTKENGSPYGIERDWCESPEKAVEKGFRFKEVSSWLRPLVEEEALKCSSEDAKVLNF